MTGERFPDHAFNRLVVSIACLVYLAGYAGYCFSESIGAFRYLVYAVPPILITSIMRNPMTSHRSALAFFITYVSLGFLNYLVGVKDVDAFVKEFTIMVLIIVSFVPVLNVTIYQIRGVFLCSLAYFALAYALTDHGGVRLLQVLASGSGSGVESGFDNHQGGLLGPIYAVFFYAIGAKIQFLLALVMSLMGGKRVGVIAIIIGILSASLLHRVAALKDRRSRFLFLFGVLAVINIMALNLIPIAEYAHWTFRMAISIEEIMLGRHAISSEMLRVVAGRPLAETLIGFGPGSADVLASLVSEGTLTQPHNDWLRIVYGYGIFGSIVITVFLALAFSGSTTAVALAITNAIMMITDNILIYLYYQFPVVLMIAYSAVRQTRGREPMDRLTPQAAQSILALGRLSRGTLR
jgi:hypothetical protein